MKASLNASEEEIIKVTITAHPPHITHYQGLFTESQNLLPANVYPIGYNKEV
jgi:hypothetical protein